MSIHELKTSGSVRRYIVPSKSLFQICHFGLSLVSVAILSQQKKLVFNYYCKQYIIMLVIKVPCLESIGHINHQL